MPSPFLIFPPGHPYSPLPEYSEIEPTYEAVLQQAEVSLVGLDLDQAGQTALSRQLQTKLEPFPWQERPQESCRYGWENGFFGLGDAAFAVGMLRYLRPRRILEVGAGHSTALFCDYCELDGQTDLEIQSIEPDSGRLREVCSNPPPNLAVVEQQVQNLDLSYFQALEAKDVLFIDSSHVGKFGSDVLFLISSVLPILRPGVFIHFHDIFWPFEYPKSWLLEGRAWNEAYLLRAFLQFNRNFKIRLFSHFLYCRAPDCLPERVYRSPGGSFWLERVSPPGD